MIYVRTVNEMEKEYLIRECRRLGRGYYYIGSSFYVNGLLENDAKRLFREAELFHKNAQLILDQKITEIDKLFKEESIQVEIDKLREIYEISKDEEKMLVKTMRYPAHHAYAKGDPRLSDLITLLKRKDTPDFD